MTFHIRIVERHAAPSTKVLAEISIGEYTESFRLIVSRWRPEDYVCQWEGAARALAECRVDCCIFVTDIQPPAQSSSLGYWVLFREGDRVVAQERFLRHVPQVDLFDPEAVAPAIPPRFQGSLAEQREVSEWTASMSDIRRFVLSSSGPGFT